MRYDKPDPPSIESRAALLIMYAAMVTLAVIILYEAAGWFITWLVAG